MLLGVLLDELATFRPLALSVSTGGPDETESSIISFMSQSSSKVSALHLFERTTVRNSSLGQ